MKKTLIVLIAAALLVIGTCSSALAYNKDFSFNLIAGGASDRSYSTEKTDGETRWYCTPKSSQDGRTSTWSNGNTVRFRARFDNEAAASDLCSRTNPNYGTRFSFGYFAGCARAGEKYRLYADVPSGSPSCKVVGTWCP